MVGQMTNVGGPKTSNAKIKLHALTDVNAMPEFDLTTTLANNAINEANKVGAYMFGYEHSVNYNLSNSGEWETLLNGDRIWRIKIQSAGALSLNFVFTDFEIPQGGHLHIYNPDKSIVIGAYVNANNTEDHTFGTELMKGDVAILEYYEPASQAQQGRLQLGTIVHGYKDINGWYTEKVNESGACNMDVMCPDGAPWQDESRAVAMIVSGGGICSGTLLNDVPQDGIPYFLTANHCGPGSMGSYVFRFNYNSTVCGSQSSANSVATTINNSINGSSLKATKSDSDFGLIELNSTPPASYNVYYAGWDNTGAIPQSAVGIHHPRGDVKKISFDDDPLQSAAGLSSVANSEWRIEAWERSTTTEPASSGSGLFDQNHRIIGQLHGGTATCSNSIDDFYGKFSMSWNGNGSSVAGERLQNWLDPQNTGATTADGWDPNGPSTTYTYDAGFQGATAPVSNSTLCSGIIQPIVTVKNFGSTTLTSLTINYSVVGGANQTYNWTGSLVQSATASVTLPSFTIPSNGAQTLSITSSNPNGQTDENNANDNLNVSFIAIANAQQMLLTLDMDCYGSEISWNVKEQGTNTVLFSGGNYSNESPNGEQIIEEFCLANGCYTFTIEDSFGDGLNGASCSGVTAGDYKIEDYYQNSYATMQVADGDFGGSATHDFCVSNVGIDEKTLASIIGVYPNPTKDVINIRYNTSESENLTITLLDTKGAVILNNISANTATVTQIDIANLSKGVYFLSIKGKSGNVMRKVIKK